ncbi:unnamed protein product [Ectocarpus sp. 12 AP-2014]
MRSMSLALGRPLSLAMVILFSLAVDFFTACTLRMPLASMLKVTSTCGCPRGIGGIPSRLNLPSRLQSRVMARSPSNNWMRTPRLVVGVGREDLRPFRGRHGGVPLDDVRHDAAGGS